MNTEQKTITVRIANNYGTEAIYPVCEDAMIFADIARTKTLTRNTLQLIKALGYEIKVQQHAGEL